MQRRRYLSLCATTASVAIAGCSGDANTNATPRDAVYENALRDAMTDEGMTVRTLSETNGTVTLEYSPAEPTEESVEASVDTTATAFFYRVEGGWPVDLLDARVLIDGTLVATWQMRRSWIESYLDGEITRDELGAKVRASVERHHDGSDGGTPSPGPSQDPSPTRSPSPAG